MAVAASGAAPGGAAIAVQATAMQRAGAAAARVLRRARSILSVVRPATWVLIFSVLALWTAGHVLGWWELTVAAVVVSVVLLLCTLFLIGRTAYEVALDLNRSRVVVGERAVGALTLTNGGSRAILPARVVLPVGGGRGVFDVRRLAAGESVEELFAIPTQKRGILKVGPVAVLRGDPLGLFERIHRREEPVDLYVHPKTVLFDGQSLGFLRDLEGLPATDLSPDDVSFHALREYHPGDDLRHVHWKSTARTGTVMVRQYEETRRSHFVIALSRHPSDFRTAEEFELAISAAGSLGLRALRDSQHVEVRVQGRALPASSGKQFLDSLSGLEYAPGREGDLVDLAGSVGATLALASVVVLVTGSKTTAEDLRAACSRLPYGARVLVVVAEEAATPTLRRIGEADVVTVGALEQLAGALRKVLA